MQPDSQLPADTTVVRKVGPWNIHVSGSSFAMYIETTDYHALPLKLTLSDLQELTRIMERVREEAKRDAISALQQSLKQMIADDPSKKVLEGSRIELIPPGK